MKADLEEMEASVPEPQGLEMVSKMMDFGIQLLDQAETLSLTLELNGTDLQISPFLKFKEGSEAQTFFWGGAHGVDASRLSLTDSGCQQHDAISEGGLD